MTLILIQLGCIYTSVTMQILFMRIVQGNASPASIETVRLVVKDFTKITSGPSLNVGNDNKLLLLLLVAYAILELINICYESILALSSSAIDQRS